jgi:hypothetical protein
MTTVLGMALFESVKSMERAMDGAITTGITPEPDGRATPATLTEDAGARKSRGNLLSRAWRLAARPAARPKAVGCTTC